MENKILDNLVFLVKNLRNLEDVLLHLLQDKIISVDEQETILSKDISSKRNTALWLLMTKKDWEEQDRDRFLEILRSTTNDPCADTLEQTSSHGTTAERPKIVPRSKILKGKWWPDIKLLIKSLHKRKVGDKFLVDVLHEKIQNDENHMTVITESANASKLTGMGGMGKTLTAKWYAHEYEKEYGNILWIDCGEGSLLQSFTKLARDLDLKHRNELLEVEELSRKSYEELADGKCLLVFDNAENYQGEEGILKVLPKQRRNLYCLITSRFPDWDTQLYGKITNMQLDIFTEEESMEFLEQNLEKGIDYTEKQLKELSLLMGNLPLALQLAVSAINKKKINLQTYIEKTSVKDAEMIVNEKFEDYEKKINMNVEISLELIAGEEGGDLARELLMIFGYISPDDIPIEFFEHVLNSKHEITKSIELLIQYSLIAKDIKQVRRSKDDDGELAYLFPDNFPTEQRQESVLSIHRLLQQVIRLHAQQTEKETLRKILGCEGFTDLKLVPFTKYADEDLQKEFPKVKAELLDQKQLWKLLREERFGDAVQLSRFINKEINTNTSLFNYASCLEKNGDLEEAVTILEKLYEKEMEEESTGLSEFAMGILHLEEVLTKDVAAGYLTVLCWKMNNMKTVKEILEKGNPFATCYSINSFNTFLQILNSNLISSNYSLKCNNLIRLKFNVQTKSAKLDDCSVYSGIKLPSDLQELELIDVAFDSVTGETIESLDLREFLPLKLNKLCIRYGGISAECIFQLDGISSIEYLTLVNCSLSLDSSTRISPKELTLNGVTFIQNGEKQEVVKINDFIDFHKLNKMTLNGEESKMSIDFGEESLSLEYLQLLKIELLNWKEGNWSVQELQLYGIPFVQKTNMKIKELFMVESTLDVSCLSQDIEKLSLREMKEVVRSGGIECPKLKYLKLRFMSSSCLSLFNSINLTHVHFNWTEDVDVNMLPESVEEVTIEIRDDTIPIVGGPRKIKKLILKELFTAEQKDKVLRHLQPENLVWEERKYKF